MSRRAPKSKKRSKKSKIVQTKPISKPEPVKKRTSHKKPFFKNGITKIKDDIGVRLSESACEQLNFIVQVLARELSSDARNTCINNNKMTVSPSEIMLAVKMRFQGKLLDDTLKVIETSIAKAHSASENRRHNEGPTRREVSAGLKFPVCLTGKFVRNFGNSGLNVGKFAPVALTATLEHVATQILTRSAEQAKRDKRVTIKPRDMFLAIFRNNSKDLVQQDLHQLMNTYNIMLMGVGVCPFIHQSLIKKRKAKGKKKSARRPGVVAIKNIKEYQQNGKLLLQKSPFDNIVKGIAQQMQSEDIRFGSWTKNVIQSFVEEQVVHLIQVANEYVVLSKREGVKDSDLENAWTIKFPWIPQTQTEASYNKKDSETGEITRALLGNKGIKRLSQRGGAKSLRSEGYSVIRRFVHSLITIVMRLALNNLKYRKVITIGLNDLQTSFYVLGYNYAFLPPKVKSSK